MKSSISTWQPVTLVTKFAKDPVALTPQFDVIQMNMLLHRFRSSEQQQILEIVRQLLRPGGWIIIIDIHKGPMVIACLQKFVYLIAGASRSRNFVDTNQLPKLVKSGFTGIQQTLIAGGVLQRIVAKLN